jgi:hypothetical protein
MTAYRGPLVYPAVSSPRCGKMDDQNVTVKRTNGGEGHGQSSRGTCRRVGRNARELEKTQKASMSKEAHEAECHAKTCADLQ